jgi:hypothetical protein
MPVFLAPMVGQRSPLRYVGMPPWLKADAAVIAFSGQKDGSLRVTYSNWADAAVFKPGESIELRCEQGQVWAYRRGKSA